MFLSTDYWYGYDLLSESAEEGVDYGSINKQTEARHLDYSKHFLNVHTLQHILENMFAITELPMVFIDSNGMIVARTELYEICERCPAAGDTLSIRCIEKQVQKMHTATPICKKSKCPGGLCISSKSISSNRMNLGSFYFVQYLESPFDYDRVRKAAVKHWPDNEVFLRELEKIPVMQEEQLRAIAELLIQLTNNDSLTTVSAGIVHEITQPVNSIRVAADGILYWYKRGQQIDIVEAMEKLEQISIEVSRMERIIKYIRSLAESRHQIEKTTCDLNQTAITAVSYLNEPLINHNINIKLDLDHRIPSIMANNSCLEEVFINLINNAIQALAKSDKALKEILCSTQLDNKQIILEIADNATGINEDISEAVFEPFYSTKDQGEGMGLGLFIVRAIVSELGGWVAVTNNPRGGATFRISLPVTNGTG
ncbi:MAG: ATP-binding protein [Candidatus Saccharibacteria bacterium]